MQDEREPALAKAAGSGINRWRTLLAVLTMLLVCLNCEIGAPASAQLKGQDQPAGEHPAKTEGVIFGRVLSAPGTIGPHGAAEPVGVGGQQVEIIDPHSGKTVAQTTSVADGSFRLTLRPGTYLLQAVGVKRYVRVDAGQEQEANMMLAVP